MEIERKFQIKEIPKNLSTFSKEEIEQGYLCLSDPVIRIRKSNQDYLLTYKSRIGMAEDNEDVALTCDEVELVLTKTSYEELRQKTDHNIIRKSRYKIPIDKGLVAELDVFHEKLEGLIFVEVEFPNEEEAKKFIPPPCFGEDVTFDKRYKNNYLTKIDHIHELDIRPVKL